MQTVDLDGLTVAYRCFGDGPPVLLLHGWPTSSYLWRNVVAPIAEHNHAIVVDLPGFGESSKPTEGYDFAFFDRVLDGFLEALGIDQVALGAHDLGGPIALHWESPAGAAHPAGVAQHAGLSRILRRGDRLRSYVGQS